MTSVLRGLGGLAMVLCLVSTSPGQGLPTWSGPIAPGVAQRHPLPADPTPYLPYGQWHEPFNHDLAGFSEPLPEGFNCIHMALIPKGPHRGKVLAWDNQYGHAPSPATWFQRWAIVDAVAEGGPRFINHELQLPDDEGDLFCAGLAWTPDGDLFVAGGTSRYAGVGGHTWLGGEMAFLMDPSRAGNAAWQRLPDMNEPRWYPTVSMMGDGTMAVYGGTEESPPLPHNTYEILDPQTDTWTSYPGPSVGVLGNYPRMHLLSSGEIFRSGHTRFSAKLTHPGQWTLTSQTLGNRLDEAALLLPTPPGYSDYVMIIGGMNNGLGTVYNSVQICNAGSPDPQDWEWQDAPPLNVARWRLNAVTLPDATILVVGGTATESPIEDPVYIHVPELFKDGAWWRLPPQDAIRDYHSTALLLPTGQVLSAGGDNRDWDYQVFDPPYLTSGLPRPVITAAPTTMAYGDDGAPDATIEFEALPEGDAVVKAVLMRPGAVTHHTDYDQRYIELVTRVTTATSITVASPPHGNRAPPGYYMLFLISARGTPSEAAWTRLIP